MVSATPASGAKLRSSPSAIDLTFDRLVGSGRITVTGPQGRADTGTTSERGPMIGRELRSDLPDGTYRVTWEADLILGDDVSGSYTFAIQRRPVAQPSATVAPTPKPTTPKPAPSKTARPTPSRTPAPSPTTTPTAEITTPSQALALAATSPDITATVPAPMVQTVAATGSGHLPSPVVLWGLILVLCVIAVLINRWRQSRGPAQPASRQVPRGQTLPSTGPTRRSMAMAGAPAAADDAARPLSEAPPTGVTRAFIMPAPLAHPPASPPVGTPLAAPVSPALQHASAGSGASAAVALPGTPFTGAMPVTSALPATPATPVPAVTAGGAVPAIGAAPATTGSMRRSELRRAERDRTGAIHAAPPTRRSELGRRTEPSRRADAKGRSTGPGHLGDDPTEQIPGLLPRD